MRVLICGSRDWSDEDAIHARLEALTDECKGTLIVIVGGCRGADRIALHPHLVIAFHKDGSRGTAHMVNSARRYGIPVEVITPGVRVSAETGG